MICNLKDEQGRIIAYTEYNIVDIKGNPTLMGDYCFIFDTWVHPEYRYKGLLRKMLLAERNKYPLVTYIYWTRGKYGKRMSKYEIKEIIYGRRQGTASYSSSSNA